MNAPSRKLPLLAALCAGALSIGLFVSFAGLLISTVYLALEGVANSSALYDANGELSRTATVTLYKLNFPETQQTMLKGTLLYGFLLGALALCYRTRVTSILRAAAWPTLVIGGLLSLGIVWKAFQDSSLIWTATLWSLVPLLSLFVLLTVKTRKSPSSDAEIVSV